MFTRLHHSSLNLLEESLPGILMSSKSNNTITTYTRGSEVWKKWASQFKQINLLPAQDYFVALFFASMIKEHKSFNTVKKVFYGLKFFHDMANAKNPCKSSTVRLLLAAAWRKLPIPVKKKELIKPKHLKNLVHFVMKEGNRSLFNLRTLSMCLIGYAGFLRFIELVSIKRLYIFIRKMYMKIFLEKSKTDMYREGSWVLIA